MSIQSVAVVGSGIGGLAAAWLLDRRYRVTLFEREPTLGGHSNTLTVSDPAGDFPVDTGFMVFNRRNYPLLCGLFAHLGVASYPTSMSFSASIDGGRVEYSGSDANGLFGQRRNLLRPGFLRMLWDIVRFNRDAKRFVAQRGGLTLTLGDFLERGRYSRQFAEHYLLPVAGAIWSCPTARMRAFPFLTFARFFANHGLLDLVDRPVWQTVEGGSRAYVERLREGIAGEIRTGCEVLKLRRLDRGVEIETARGERMRFDAVVLGCHGDEALRLIESPSEPEQDILGAFRYEPNRVFVHEDTDLMPRRCRVWSSWNYLRPPGGEPDGPVTVTYWMNNLQDLPTRRNILVSLNPAMPPRPETVIAELAYSHPIFDARAIAAQARIAEIQGVDRIWFSGAYLGYGFHEDGLRAAVDVAAALGVPVPWSEAQPAAAPRPTPAPVGVPGPAHP